MTNDNYQAFLKSLIGKLFKILPLYEDKNAGLTRYLESLIYKLEQSENVFGDKNNGAEFGSILLTLHAIKADSIQFDRDKSFIKSEVFHLIDIINKMQVGEKQ